MHRLPTVPKSASFPQPLDRLAIAAIVLVALIIGLVVLTGSRIAPRVRYFTWANKQVGADDTAFVMTFSRPMDHASVEKNLVIQPSLPGKVSWAGRRMAYTLTIPAPYGTAYTVKLRNAVDYFSQGDRRIAIQPFTAQFHTRDRAFAYIGITGEEAGRLVLFNLTKNQRSILTPPDLVVNEFKPYPLGDRILFGASNRSQQSQGLLEQKLYRVATGLQIQPPDQLDPQSINPAPSAAKPATTLEQVLDSNDYQNLKFELSADGKIIVIQRVSRTNPADFGPWILRDGAAPQPLKGQPGGDFLITPDSNSLAIAQGQGLALLPLYPDAKPLDFLPKFGVVLNFAEDGSQAAMVKFNGDRTRSLFLVSNQGTQTELLRTTGSIFSAQFDPTKQVLYCLLSELIPGETYQEKPFLAAIELKTSKITPLMLLPNQRDTQVSLSPDGLAILYDQMTETQPSDLNSPRNQGGQAIADSQLWILPLNPAEFPNLKPKQLPFSGLRPRWMP